MSISGISCEDTPPEKVAELQNIKDEFDNLPRDNQRVLSFLQQYTSADTLSRVHTNVILNSFLAGTHSELAFKRGIATLELSLLLFDMRLTTKIALHFQITYRLLRADQSTIPPKPSLFDNIFNLFRQNDDLNMLNNTSDANYSWCRMSGVWWAKS